eukprot:1155036-Amphidinium_carterae.2
MSSRTSPSVTKKQIMEKQMASIISSVKDDLEKQLLVINYLEGLDAPQAPKRPRRAASSEDLQIDVSLEDDEQLALQHVAITESEPLPRCASKYSTWTKDLVCDLLAWVEPRLYPKAKKNGWPVELLKQLMEMAFDLICVEVPKKKVQSDRPSSLASKLTTFNRLRCMYIALGKRLRVVQVQDGNVNWGENGLYAVTGGGDAVTVTHRFSLRTARIPCEFLSSTGPQYSSKDISMNYSKISAHLHLSSGELQLATLFPEIGNGSARSLARRFSDELGVTGGRLQDSADGGAIGKGSKKGNTSKGAESQSDVNSSPSGLLAILNASEGAAQLLETPPRASTAMPPSPPQDLEEVTPQSTADAVGTPDTNGTAAQPDDADDEGMSLGADEDEL